MQAETYHPLEHLRSPAEATAMKAALDGLLDAEMLSRCRTGPVSMRMTFYLFMAALSSAPLVDPMHECSSQVDMVTQLLHSATADRPETNRSLIAEWSQLVPVIQTLTVPCQRELARIITGLAPYPNSIDDSLEKIALRLCSIDHILQAHHSLPGNVAVGIHDPIALSCPLLEPVCPSASEAQPPASSPRKTRSGNSYPRLPTASVKSLKRPPKEAKKKRAAPKTSTLRKAQKVSGNSTSCITSPISPVQSEAAVTWTSIKPLMRDGAVMTTATSATASRPSASGKPHIWAATRQELTRILPEIGEDNIVFGNSETPLLFLEGPSWKEDRWDGGKVIELSMVKEFIHALPGFAVSSRGDRIIGSAQPHAAPQVLTEPLPSSSQSHLPRTSYGANTFALGTSQEPIHVGCAPVYGQPSNPRSISAPDASLRTANTMILESEPFPLVIQDCDGTYRFAQEQDEHPSHAPVQGFVPQPSYDPQAPIVSAPSTAPPTADLTALAPNQAPPEIEALLLSKQTCIPVNIVVCRNAVLSPITLPDGCDCAFLGFFFVTNVHVRTEVFSSEVVPGDRPMTLVRGRKTWCFRFEWTPGGEDAGSPIARSSTPWWMPAAPPSRTANEIEVAIPVQHPYTILPLHFLAPPAQIVCTDADVKTWLGWHCGSCGKLNLQLNLCYQRCNSCSTPNGLPPIPVEYVRQVRGTDPIAFPWDRFSDSVPCDSSDGPDGLRDFTYALSKTAVVHHMFTCNRSAAQAEPTQLFSDLQAEVELASEPTAKSRAGGAIGPYYTCMFSYSSARSTGRDAYWSSSVPASVSRARELMLRRTRTSSIPTGLKINVLTISAWRTAGNKKGCVFAAERSPIVFLCLGADVEMTFWRGKNTASLEIIQSGSSGAAGALPPALAGLRSISPDPALDDGDADEAPYEPLMNKGNEDIDCVEVASAAAGAAAAFGHVPASATKLQKGKGRASLKRDMEEVLMATLVHGDVLVVHGAVFEYSIKRTGMSIVLFGQQ